MKVILCLLLSLMVLSAHATDLFLVGYNQANCQGSSESKKFTTLSTCISAAGTSSQYNLSRKSIMTYSDAACKTQTSSTTFGTLDECVTAGSASLKYSTSSATSAAIGLTLLLSALFVSLL